MSSGGGLLQLVAQGAQDTYLTSQPQITFFRTAYRRYTNFSMESIEQVFSGNPDFGRKVTCTIARTGDLISKMYLRAVLPALNTGPLTSGNPTAGTAQWVPNVGNALISSVSLQIGGSQIDKHYADYLQIWHELSQDEGVKPGYHKMVGNFTVADCISPQTIYVPFVFFFNKKYGLALPLIALQYHEVRVDIEFAPFASLLSSGGALPPTGPQTLSLQYASLFVDYIFLDSDERTRFANASHEYLIEQLQFTGDESLTGTNGKLKLGFNHPVKELIWVAKVDYLANTLNQTFNYTDDAISSSKPYGGANPIATAKLQINGQDRMSEREGLYFNTVQPWQHHTNTPPTGVNVYSFSLMPEDHQPSGTCNFSRLDSVNLQLKLTDTAVTGSRTVLVKVYAINYNVLRVTAGMGGVAYAS